MKNILLLSTAVASLRMVAFMSDRCATVTIKGADGNPMVINESDFNEEEHERMEVETAKDDNGNVVPTDSQGNALTETGDKQITPEQKVRDFISSLNAGVQEKGRKFYVVDASDNGKPVTALDVDGEPLFNVKGYKSNADAWSAVMSIKQRSTGAVAGGATPAGTHQPDEAANGTPKLDDAGQPVMHDDGVTPVMVDADGNDIPLAE